jgi:hypothetical protein
VGKKEKLIARLKSIPRDFTFEEAKNLLELLGFRMSNKGRTCGSRVKFLKDNTSFYVHKPHPRKELLEYQIKNLLETLERENLL